jgi:hypothetical protein
MTEAEQVRAIAARAALAAACLAAVVLMPDPDRLLFEGQSVMSRNAGASDKPSKIGENTMLPARDPKIAVEEEYQIALRQGTAQALELFVARHPDDPHAEKARVELRRLSR